MAVTKKTAKAVEAVATEVKATAVAAPVEEKAAAKKTSAKKAPAKKTAEKKAPAKKAAKAAEVVYVQYRGAEYTTTELIAKAKADAGVSSAKKVDIYVKPEENKVYYVIDDKTGSFFLV